MHSDREVPDAPPAPADVPPSGIYEELLHMDRLTTSAELRMAMKRMQGAQRLMEDGEWHADAMLVLRAVLTAADEKLRELRRRE